MNTVTLLIGGDLAPTKSNYSFFEEGNIKSIIDERLLDLINSVDYRVFNLEVPLTDRKKHIRKDGPNLIAPTLTINGIKLLNPTVLGLANNHILDQDEQGLYQTIELLEKHEIHHVGVGKNLENAAKPLILNKDGIKFGIYACTENEFSIAEENRAGANPFDPLESPDHLLSLKSKCDFVIVLYHGGKEHYRYPSPDLQKVCRKMVEKGADLIICQHSHCIGAFEKYHESVIVYGQGNFVFDLRDNEFWATGLLIKASFGEKMSVDFIPICKKGNGVELPAPDASEAILAAFYERSKQISEPGFVDTEFDKFCSHNGQYYLAVFAGFGRILRNIDKLFNGIFTKQIYTRKKVSQIQNHVECESHRELLIRYLRIRSINK
jgi:poly-gamma-glutamate synthesis protein (capsule biosynthesis protein)